MQISIFRVGLFITCRNILFVFLFSVNDEYLLCIFNINFNVTSQKIQNSNLICMLKKKDKSF